MARWWSTLDAGLMLEYSGWSGCLSLSSNTISNMKTSDGWWLDGGVLWMVVEYSGWGWET